MALLSVSGQLFVGGLFQAAGGMASPNIASWDGVAWSPMGLGMSGWVGALCVYSDELVAAGSFTMAGGIPANRVAAWNGIAWHPFGNGVNSFVRCATVYRGDLFVGGGFTQAGEGVPSCCLATWKPSCLRGDLNCDGALGPADIPDLAGVLLDPLGWPLCEQTIADMNRDGLVDGRDIAEWTSTAVGQ